MTNRIPYTELLPEFDGRIIGPQQERNETDSDYMERLANDLARVERDIEDLKIERRVLRQRIADFTREI